MASYGTVSLLAQAEAAGRVLVTPMGGVQFVPFTQISSIGTRDLAGCSVVIIASQYGAILAHIVPRPPTAHPSDTTAGDRNVQQTMKRVAEVYNEHRNYFPSADTYAVFAVWEGEVALKDQKRTIERKIEDLGLAPFHTVLYVTPRDPTNAGQGTAFVDAQNRGNEKPRVYVEDRLVSSEQQSQHTSEQSVQRHSQQGGQQSNNGWIWCPQYLRWYVMKDGQRVYAPA